MSVTLTTPVGRIVQGELWKALGQKDNKGAVKLGPDQKPLVDYFFALAIAKQPGHTHWAQTDWGRQIWEEGHKAHPNFAPHPTFSWKIEDGDSVVPNKKGKRNCDREGFPGHWVIKMRSGFQIPTYNANGTAPMPPEAFKTGHYAQVSISVKGNTGDTPGVYINPQMVALSGYGVEIINALDASEAGFGAAPLPAGASAAPLSVALPLPAGSVPGAVPSMPGMPAPAPAAAVPSPVPMPAAAPVPVAVPPNPAFLAGPGGVPAVPGVPMPAPAPMAPPAPAAPAYQMTAAANGYTRDQLVAQGWTDAQLRAGGLML